MSDDCAGEARSPSLAHPDLMKELVGRLPYPVYIADADGTLFDANAAFLALIGLGSIEDLGPYRLQDFLFDPTRRDREVELLKRDASVRDFLLEFRDAEGVRRLLSDTCFHAGALSDGRPIFLGILHEVAKVAGSVGPAPEQEPLPSPIESPQDAILVFDAESGRFADVNENAQALFGFSRSALLDAGPGTLSPPFQPDGTPSELGALQKIQEALDGEALRFYWVHRNAAGEDIHCEVRLMRLPAAGRKFVRASVTDLDARQRREDRIREVQKLEVLGRLTAGVAHDFNSYLATIGANCQLLQQGLVVDREGLECLAQIRWAVDRGTALIREVVSFTKPEHATPEPRDINAVVADVSGLLGTLVGAGVRLVSILEPDLPPVAIHRTHLEQVILNLATNARDAMPSGGTLTIQTAATPLVEHCDVEVGLDTAEPWVILTVKDTGHGMSEEVRARIFEPFFSTKGPGTGSGLGLSTVQQIVTRYAGSICVASEEGRGSVFEIRLPAVPSVAYAH